MAPSRRRLLAGIGASLLGGVAGCGGDADQPRTTTRATTPRPTTDETTVASTTTTDGGNGPSTTAGSTPTTEANTPTTTPPPAPDRIALEPLATGMQTPLDIAFAPDADRRYIADQPGLLHVHERGGFTTSPLLDLTGSIETGYEKGLLGVTLHPEFATNRRLFVRYSSPPRSGTPSGYSHTFVLSEVLVSEDGRTVVEDSERAILEIPEPQGNHNAGSIAFGPDGFLYVGVGDGGAAGDQGTGHVGDWYGAVDGGNGQDVEANLLGSVLRIDVDVGPRGEYAVPEDNPLDDEHYAWGFRNPWRFSFDGERLFVGDVGQNAYEEVDLVVRGGNYGWNVREGTHCFQAESCPDSTPASVRGGEPLRPPIIEYPHSGQPVHGRSVIGGYVARDPALPGLAGRYVFGDLQANGRLFLATPPDGDGRWETRELWLVDADVPTLDQLYGFGRDPTGRVYVLGRGEGGGGLHRITPAN